MVRGVVFDLFHTLTAPETQWSSQPWTSDVLGIDRRVWNELLTAGSRWRLAGEETDPYTIIATLARSIDPGISDGLIERAVEVRVGRFRDAFDRVPVEHVETLKRLRARGFRLGLISNADVMEMAPWDRSPLAGLFDAEIFSCRVGHVKPEPAIYLACLDALGLHGEECLFVGDGGSNELAGARAVGMTPVFMSGIMEELWPDQIPARLAQCDHHVRSIREVLSLPGVAEQTGEPV